MKDGKNTAHKLMPRLSTEWNAGCITVRLTILIYDFMYVNLFSCTVGQGNSVIRDLLTGTTSNTAWKLFAQRRPKKIVRISTLFFHHFLDYSYLCPKSTPRSNIWRWRLFFLPGLLDTCWEQWCRRRDDRPGSINQALDIYWGQGEKGMGYQCEREVGAYTQGMSFRKLYSKLDHDRL